MDIQQDAAWHFKDIFLDVQPIIIPSLADSLLFDAFVLDKSLLLEQNVRNMMKSLLGVWRSHSTAPGGAFCQLAKGIREDDHFGLYRVGIEYLFTGRICIHDCERTTCHGRFFWSNVLV